MSLSADVTAASRSDAAALAVAGGSGAGGPHGGGGLSAGHGGPSSVASLSSAISSLASTLLNIRNKSPAAGEGRRSKSGEGGLRSRLKLCQQYSSDCYAYAMSRLSVSALTL